MVSALGWAICSAPAGRVKETRRPISLTYCHITAYHATRSSALAIQPACVHGTCGESDNNDCWVDDQGVQDAWHFDDGISMAEELERLLETISMAIRGGGQRLREFQDVHDAPGRPSVRRLQEMKEFWPKGSAARVTEAIWKI
ncbi:LOW QUALITY PROTEIN: hypothetical protein CH63R_03513 [Colletotrichum higginsianum IMI 349063]|uniref:Uncharacterized protein n=1 Tax=Colletotrichum higginsianum (strain IMI 349063) TaxID=759273 RepID=A0A1B7YRX0_COLHI|nr:LOW QUALITY PROTEIN: hypothetical protein CH63R_03513 [Colletotrichum higginsianum IMI 349063]OBR14787.1 LOW QUALITY PROTEIN: hypothetical protein CH63R_03513 [Colletotrichum higginsianum IMI 349063]GJD05211.1 hypothetical protein ColKHC_14036 [Colletotrichum higginsianum]